MPPSRLADVCPRPNPWGVGTVPNVTVPPRLLLPRLRRGPVTAYATAGSPVHSQKATSRHPAGRLWLAGRGQEGKGASPPDPLATLLERARFLHRSSPFRIVAKEGFITGSPCMATLIKWALHFADHPTMSVLLQGETGTGKEVLAQTIHRLSPRSNGPFVALNCGAIPETLLESELFGYVRGAFTDAGKDKPGLIERANGGALFLDEIGELPTHLQVKLLRLLDKRVVVRLGDSKERPVDFRLITATNRDLKRDKAEGRFREDLYFRIAVGLLHLPPLRERPEDILLLAEYFLELTRKKEGIADTLSMDSEFLKALLSHPWPGNIRELQHMVESIVVLRKGSTLTIRDLPSRSVPKGGLEFFVRAIREIDPQATLADLLRNRYKLWEVRTAYVALVLKEYQGNIARAAQHLGIPEEEVTAWTLFLQGKAAPPEEPSS